MPTMLINRKTFRKARRALGYSNSNREPVNGSSSHETFKKTKIHAHRPAKGQDQSNFRLSEETFKKSRTLPSQPCSVLQRTTKVNQESFSKTKHPVAPSSNNQTRNETNVTQETFQRAKRALYHHGSLQQHEQLQERTASTEESLSRESSVPDHLRSISSNSRSSSSSGERSSSGTQETFRTPKKSLYHTTKTWETVYVGGGQLAPRNTRRQKDDDDSTSILSYGPEGQEWQIAVAKSDFNEILRLLKIHPSLARHKDIANGYTALHWAAKQGRTEVVKLLAGTHHVEINAKSNGGYTPLHIAAMYNRTEVFDLLVHYGADLNMRDYSGKKPRTYNTIASTVSQDTQRRIVQRRNSVKDAAAFLRIGSLNVKVRKTTEAFNSLLSRDVEAKLHRAWGSSDSLPDAEKETKLMPPPKFGPIKKRKLKKDRDAPAARPVSAYSVLTPSEDNSASMQTPSGTHVNADSDSDSAYGFGSEWH